MNLVGAISAEKLGNLKRRQYAEKLVLEDTVPAGETQEQIINISHIGDFLCLYITGKFTTLALSGETVIDNGVCALRGLLYDGTGTRKLFNDFIPLDLFFSPGRVKDTAAANVVLDDVAALRADPSMQLFYPNEFQNLFDVNSTIRFDVKNDSDYENYYAMCFHGIRLLRD